MSPSYAVDKVAVIFVIWLFEKVTNISLASLWDQLVNESAKSNCFSNLTVNTSGFSVFKKSATDNCLNGLANISGV